MSEAGIYSVDELFAFEMSGKPLIDKLLWRRDNIFLVGHEKSGKSILAMQLAFSLTSGQPFLGEYEVAEVSNVLYVQTEGKLVETKERMISMMKINDCDKGKLHIAYFPSIALDTPNGFDKFIEYITEKKLSPNVIILDPLYHSMEGSLIDERDARRMTANLRKLSDKYDATVIVVHHTHRPVKIEGKAIDEGDDAIFGSFVWKAWADHILLFRVERSSSLRILSCNTQRSGRILKRDELFLSESPSLSFERKEEEGRPYEIKVRRAIEEGGEEGATREGLHKSTGLALTSIDKSLRKLITLGEIKKESERRPNRYSSTKYHKPADIGQPGPTSAV